MGLSLSTDLILGLLLGAVGALLFQQLTRATGSLGRFMPLLLILGIVACGVLTFMWLRG